MKLGYSQDSPECAGRVLTRVMLILSTHWTNRGYKIRQEGGGFKFCVLGAIDQAMLQLFGRTTVQGDLCQRVLQDVAVEHFKMSFVSVNDELGLSKTIQLLSLAIEKLWEEV